MDLEQLTQYIKAEYLILVAVLYCIRQGLQGVVRFPVQFLPFVLGGCGVALACLSAAARYAEYGNLAALAYDGIVQGILCAGVSASLGSLLSHCGLDNSKNKKEK